MNRLIVTITVVLLSAVVLGLLPPVTYGQGAPYNPYTPVQQPPGYDARAKRAARERAVATVGPVARSLVEKYGEDAVDALRGCSKPFGQKLAEWCQAGELEKLPRPNDFLKVVARKDGGDDLVAFAIAHSRELSDVDQFNALLETPLDYALGLRLLVDGAAEARARRLAGKINQDLDQPWTAGKREMFIAGCGVLIGVCVVILWWRWRQRAVAGYLVHG